MSFIGGSRALLFGLMRLLFGLGGLYYLIAGLLMGIVAVGESAWGGTLYALLTALSGWCALYCAVVRFPWEDRRNGPAAPTV
jgi:hypothetical protein